jgi:GH25 family lysozyme M1 (1,4-beta-N-acetylmuramidase)
LVRALGAGIDVSKFHGNIDWNRVKASGINYAIIRCGGRYSDSRGLFEDPKYAANVAGASAAGLRVGIYFYSTATNTAEAVEEASLAVALARKGNVSLPVFIDMEDSMIPKGQATAISQAFCQTVNSAGYTSGVYANINWWTNYLDYGVLSPYKIWIARYNSSLSGGRYTWNGRCDYWQYSETGHVDGISGTVDLDYAY